MDNKGKLCLLLFLATLTLAVSKAPARKKGRSQMGQIQHIEVLTRPPTQSSGSKGGRKVGGRRNKPTTPEPDDDFLTTTASYASYEQQRGYGNNNYNTVDPFYDYGTSTGNGITTGGTSWEYDDDFTTTTGFGNYGNRNGNNGYGPSYRTNNAPKRKTPTTPEPPEAEEETPIGNMLFGSTSGLGASGFCFCSPLRSCPAKSIPRGGPCVNFMSLFTRVQFIRCCFSPSWAKNLHI